MSTRVFSSLNGSSSGGSGREGRAVDYVPGPHDTTEENIRSLFSLFNNALATGSPKIVAKRYANDAVLLPSTNEEPRMDAASILEFYEDYLTQKPHKQVLDGKIKIGHGWAEDAGICEISLQGPAGVVRKIKARYSFVYLWESQQWKILHHHSSILGAVEATPTGPPSLSGGPMTTERVQNLFQLFQDAWEIRDSDSVAKRFVANGLLLPLNVYEAPKRGYSEIRDYFDEFLLNRPIISKIDRVQISIDPSLPGHQSWAKDVGTFEITFKKDQSILHARYALDYVLDDDGIWKISQFQVTPLPIDWGLLRVPDTSRPVSTASAATNNDLSSIEPQKERLVTQPPVVTEQQVRGWFVEWNNAMATGDPNVVANRYAQQAVMMATVSDTPRTTPQEILEFYQLFLGSRPQAKSLQSFVTISTHWCKDMGILEYTLKDSEGRIQQQIKERYSFLYVFDDAGGWKIAHHHSSVLPFGSSDSSKGEKLDDSSSFQ
jgi:uncharacterized protein (TIGR02246 family)